MGLAMELFEAVMKWIVAPVAAVVWFLYGRVNQHHTDIEVIKATAQANKEAHDREFKEMRKNFERVFEKLDSIEAVLRK